MQLGARLCRPCRLWGWVKEHGFFFPPKFNESLWQV